MNFTIQNPFFLEFIHDTTYNTRVVAMTRGSDGGGKEGAV